MKYKKKQNQKPIKKLFQPNASPLISVEKFSNPLFIDSLWKEKAYEELERILKSQKQDISGSLVENLSKLAFFQHDKKFTGSTPVFVSHILTGGACLIARNPIYHHDIANEIQLLANEIKLLFTQSILKNKKKSAWDQSLIETFIDFEANILTQVLQLAINRHMPNLDFIPTPSYLLIYHAANKPAGQHFLNWLALENKALFKLYDTQTYHAVFWALSGENLSDIKPILKAANQNIFHPYLSLALMLRSSNIEKCLLKEIVQITDIANLPENDPLFKNIAIQTAKNIIEEGSKKKISTDFWQILIDFSAVMNNPELKNELVKRTLIMLHRKQKVSQYLELDILKDIAHRINSAELIEQVDALSARQQPCSQFLSDLEQAKYSKKSITSIKDEQALVSHLTLIADACYLAYPKISLDFFQHIESLITNRRINKILPLKNVFDYAFRCKCNGCQHSFYKHQIPAIIKKLNLPVIRLPEPHFYASPQAVTEKQAPRLSVLSQTNPFEILEVSLTDSKPVIMQKVLKLIQQSPEKMALFRQAQSELFNPEQKFLHHYFRYFAHENNPANLATHAPVALLKDGLVKDLAPA